MASPFPDSYAENFARLRGVRLFFLSSKVYRKIKIRDFTWKNGSLKTFKQRKTNFMSFLRETISPEPIIQRNSSYKIHVFKIAAKAEKDKTQKQSQRMKNNLNRCVLALSNTYI